MLKTKLIIFFKKALLGLFFLSFLSWVTPFTISDQGGFNSSPSAAVNDSGQAVVVWTNGVYPFLTTQAAFSSASSSNSSSWSDPFTLSNEGAQFNPLSGIDAHGNCIAAWESIVENEVVIMSSKKSEMGNWENPVTLSDSPSNSSLTLAVNANGQVVVAWVDNETNAIKARHLIFGNNWSSIGIVSNQSDYVGNLQSGIDNLGNEMIVWEDFSTEMIFVATTTNGFNTPWSNGYSITKTGTNTGPSLDLEETGNAIVAWTNVDTYDIETALYQNGSWSLPVVVSDNYGSGPTVATSGTEYFVSWNDLTSGGTFGAVNEGGNWSTPFQLSTNFQTDTAQVSASLHTFFTVWSDLVTGNINLADYPTSGSSAAPILLSSQNLNISPVISSSSTTTIVAWQALVGDNTLIQVNVNQ